MAAGRKTGGRKAGTPNKATVANGASITALAQQHAPAAMQVLVDISQDPTAPAAARVTAANSILERGFGRIKEAQPDDSDAPASSVTIHVSAPVGDVRVTRSDA